MFKRRTSKVRNRRQVRKLNAHVMSPRIFWFDMRRMAGRFVRMLFLAGLVLVAGWGIWTGVEKGLLKNEEFRLSHIALNENLALDEIRLLEISGVDPAGSLFQCDAGEIESKLEALPELVAAKVKRKFPGTLVVNVTPRRPHLWVACESMGVRARDLDSGVLVDRLGVAFRCQPGLYEQACLLPVIELGEGGGPLVLGEPVEHPDFVRGLRLFTTALGATRDASRWIDTISQYKAWASQLTTRDGIRATFGHADLERQMSDLLAAVEHAREKGDRIESIQLIGKRNLPVKLFEEAPPKAIPVEDLPEEEPSGINSDLKDLLDR